MSRPGMPDTARLWPISGGLRPEPRRAHLAATGLTPRGVDALWLVSAYVIALLAIPANLTVPPLGSVGTPAVIIGLGALMWWISAQMNKSRATLSPSQPVRRSMIWFTVAVLVSYVAATTRPIEAVELSGSDRGLLLIASCLGIVLLASDGLRSVSEIEQSLRVLVALGGLVAVLGVTQFVTGQPIIDGIQIPGLSPNNTIQNITDRDGFVRAAGTSTHPIEFGVALSMILPLALHLAFADPTRNLLARWFPIAAIAVAVPITISRSALVGVVVGLVMILPSWPRHRRHMGYLAIGVLAVGIYLTIPGMLGTLTKMFTGIGEDGSAASRVDSYALAFDFIARSPIIGRGLSTFLPQYRILDNQYLGLLIEVGIVGTVALLAVFFVAIRTALITRRRSADERTRSLALALAAAVAAGACSFATFDAFGFPQVSCVVFLCIGMIGALSNLMGHQILSSGLQSPTTVRTR
ncbi:O-antigen ligase family protein [Diaminobutyricimonas sp. TR449]|uniref:O-antigen ligase family protein n=1 Tax=Diaminobutyricimonas sp. TR449 TaxID=2708076 RepID=UPI001422D897|nr:O-antigen ligase family protein [Diaminobutyricimonas sp. TR449]